MNLVSHAYENGIRATRSISKDEQKSLGQFMTPPTIAKAMAARCCAGINQQVIRILDPSAGTGILAAAAVEELFRTASEILEIQVVLIESDFRLEPQLKSLASQMRRVGRSIGVAVKVFIKIEDFLLSDISEHKSQFDLVIANPPYFKLRKQDPRSLRHAYAVYGQPNIYSLFMAATARLIVPGGRWCFITPRSWTNGPYFARVRRHLVTWLHIDAMHVFESREDHFMDDEILQEAMITWATAQSLGEGNIIVSSSEGTIDMDEATLRVLPASDVIGHGIQSVISLPTSASGDTLSNFKATLSSYGIKVSTGPVVAFRAGAYISEDRSRNSVPLLWMQHIRHMRIEWPIQKKREHICANESSAWMLVPNENMVVMRRFSPKEDRRRITAAPYLKGTLPGPVLGLENHTNYLYRPGGRLGDEEVKGLAAYLNSAVVDHYLRQIAGNTQVNASDLKNVPLPSVATLIEIGAMLPNKSSLEDGEAAVNAVLKVPLFARTA